MEILSDLFRNVYSTALISAASSHRMTLQHRYALDTDWPNTDWQK